MKRIFFFLCCGARDFAQRLSVRSVCIDDFCHFEKGPHKSRKLRAAFGTHFSRTNKNHCLSFCVAWELFQSKRSKKATARPIVSTDRLNTSQHSLTQAKMFAGMQRGLHRDPFVVWDFGSLHRVRRFTYKGFFLWCDSRFDLNSNHLSHVGRAGATHQARIARSRGVLHR